MNTLDTLIGCIKNLENPGFLKDHLLLDAVEEACASYLKSIGYKVSKNTDYYKINTIDELVDFFYNCLDYYHSEVCSLVSNRQKDRALFSKFISNRQSELGCSFKDGLQDCANIVKALFIYEDELALTLPIGTWVFGSEKCKWLTDKVINILNNNLESVNEQKVVKMIEDNERNSDDYIGFDFEKLRRMYGE